MRNQHLWADRLQKRGNDVSHKERRWLLRAEPELRLVVRDERLHDKRLSVSRLHRGDDLHRRSSK